MPIVIQRHDGLYTAEVTPPHGRGIYWRTPSPVPVGTLVDQLRDRGCHTTDITDAIYAEYPNWLEDADR